MAGEHEEKLDVVFRPLDALQSRNGMNRVKTVFDGSNY